MAIILAITFAFVAVALVFASEKDGITARAKSLLNRYSVVAAVAGTVTVFFV